MNKIFGFFKEKIVEAKVQNKKQLQSLVSVLSGDDTGYKADIILSHLQKIKSNYMTWSILIANQASTGLYYSQLHNHGVCLKKAGQEKDFEATKEKYGIIHEQMTKTHQQLKEIAALSDTWVSNMSKNMEEIKSMRIKQLQEKKTKSRKIIESEQVSEIMGQFIEEKDNSNNESSKSHQIQEQASPIIFSESSNPIIQFFQAENNSEPIIRTQKW